MRDPVLEAVRRSEPSSFGLSRIELEREIIAQRRAGWSDDELRTRFVDPRQVAA